ncbi:glycosyltransferase family 4 protein [Aspergillus alliaceus]|uniref:glycosyltransferase family 4 protein n=1 Tax=Petromyces alliaceus TaxID=209559 RepID=UPI0012A726F7|nr:uncharacterized protein BDW43DRAFT_308193 [Aspergillus alliaceus]KAB8236516.1 hypothetical protein BDW43DRAFT_308193 [Aspergillus alliaceus]
MGADFLGLDAVGWRSMVKTWWDQVLAACLLATIVFGGLYILFLVGRKIRRSWRKRHQLSQVPAAISRCLDRLSRESQPLCLERSTAKEPQSFGVFLGSLSNPPTTDEAHLLRQWDTLVLDPLQEGVLRTLSNGCTSSYTLGRLDVRALVNSEHTATNGEVIQALEAVAEALRTYFKQPEDAQSPFRGVLLADCLAHFQPVVLNKLVRFINHLGLDVWLELSPPAYISEQQCRDIDMLRIRGIIYRNGTIASNGDSRNYFQMSEMRTAMRAVAAQKSMGGSTLAIWETVDDDVELSHHVIHRTFKWCNYRSAMCWIAPHAALTDATVATVKTITEEPLGALMWMKGNDVSEAHNVWKSNGTVRQDAFGHESLYESLQSFVPGLPEKLSLLPPTKALPVNSQEVEVDELYWPSQPEITQTNPFSVSPAGIDYTGLGCFQLGLNCTSKDISDLVEAQRHVKELDLLERVKLDELHCIAGQLRTLQRASNAASSSGLSAVKELVGILSACKGSETDPLKVYVGLHSGFRTRLETQVWGMYENDSTPGALNIYLSAKAQDRTSTLLHTFMSSRGHSRFECFMAELSLSTQTGNLSEMWRLPSRIVHDIEQLTPTETILFLRRLTLSECTECSPLSEPIRACCEYQLIEVPSLSQLRTLASSAYLGGEISAEDLVRSRIEWYRQGGCWCPDPTTAISLFKEVDSRLPTILINGELEILTRLATVVHTVLQRGQIDAGADLFALSVFCAFRKLALNEVYLEVLDRNPLPNNDMLQPSCFAEMYAVGARCDMYFDMPPIVLGKIIATQYRAYYDVHQPPRRDDLFTELPTAYASMDIDLDPKGEQVKPSVFYQFTFLGIFAVPALIDIVMLTTVGRGLYLTTFMSNIDKSLATIALMVALILCGGFGGWISSGGSYYLHAMAFPAMSMFVLTRFVAGLAVAFVGGIFAMIGIGVVSGFNHGIVFFLYFVMLSTFLMTLSALSVYQIPGFQFQSGRTVIMMCIPILFISPIITIWVHHDTWVYIPLLYLFLICLLFGARIVVSQWNTWYLHIPRITDSDVVSWYLRTWPPNSLPADVEDIGTTPIPRQALQESVEKERNRRFWTRSTADPFVRELADGYPATMFLLVWYCKYSRTKLPRPYSPTWNLQLKASVQTMTDMQKGIKLHNAFLHWRHTGADVWCGILYFVLALVDKWTALLTGQSVVGLSNVSSMKYRLATGFGLAYYLMGAVILDAVSQPLWTMANRTTSRAIASLDSLREAKLDNVRARRSLYWKSLGKFFFLHMWGAAISLALMWSFEATSDATIMFLAYVGSYSGLLWYQYNKIFTGVLAVKPLALGTVIGFVLGILLHVYIPAFAYSSVISLASGTWTAALITLFMTDIWVPLSSKETDTKQASNNESPFYICSALDPCPDLSQTTLGQMFDGIASLPGDVRYKLQPSQHPGVEVMQILQSQSSSKKSERIEAAFRLAGGLVSLAAELWQRGETTIELVSAGHLLHNEQKIRAISRSTHSGLHIFVVIGPGLIRNEWTSDIRRNCKMIAEAVVQATAECKSGISHNHSLLTELLVVGDQDDEQLPVPEGVKRQLEICAGERMWAVRHWQKTLLRHLLLGLECDLDWDKLPQHIRSFLLKRCCGQPCRLSSEQMDWIRSRFSADESLGVEEFVSRCNLGATLAVSVTSFAETLPPSHDFEHAFLDSWSVGAQLPSGPNLSGLGFFGTLELTLSRLHEKVKACIKFTVISLVADPEYQRELNYMIGGQPLVLAWPATLILNGIWKFCKTLQRFLLPFVLLHGREKVSTLYKNMKGRKTVIESNRVITESLNGPSTGFFESTPDGTFRLYQYSGRHENKPSGNQHLTAINTYTDKLILRQREEFSGGSLTNEFTYEYSTDVQARKSKLPVRRQCIRGALNGQVVQYDRRGHIASGSTTQDGDPVLFQFWYRKHAKFDDELIRAEFVSTHIKIQVSWCMPPRTHPEKLNKWVPYPRITEAIFTKESDIYSAKWTYDHKFHPNISSTFNGEPSPTPPMIQDDWYNVLQKPKNCSFLDDNPLFSFSSINTGFLSRMFGLNVKRYPIPTSRARMHLWTSWKSGNEFDAATTRWLDEILLRSDHVLNPYWRNRDFGRLEAARKYLDERGDTVLARVDIDPEVSSWTWLAFKMSDLYSFGQGGDARINTRTLSTQLQDSDSQLHVLALDTATWPNEPGGVSACRRDLVNNLNTTRWHIIAEAANDFGVPRFQIERNVQSLAVIPQWGLDFLNPTHGVLQSCLDSAVAERSFDTRKSDIEQNFIPILTSLVRCARTTQLTRQHIEEATKALVGLNTYFETSRNWNDAWMSDVVKDAWRSLWLADDLDGVMPISQWRTAEHPTLVQLDTALDMWHRYLFIFSVPVPEKIPDIFQASHHFTGATYGVLCKIKRKCALHVWDHSISLREMVTFLSGAISFDSSFVNTTLIHLGRLSCVLAEHHADVVLPCAEYFNPGWETELGTCEGVLQHRRSFQRKIDPVVNGITDMEKYKPIETIKTEKPTVVMLSHIRYVKDIKTAVMATDVIVNKWGFKDYRLHIYGDMEKTPGYSSECQEIIASKGLRDYVILKGLGNPSVVLQDAWLFMNSSISEGLPLAMGEAALTGVPVVCTDVGASFCVVTDRTTGKRFSEVVAPNDALSLAQAQIRILALLDEWAPFAEDEAGHQPPKLSLRPTPEEVEQISRRMYAKTNQRRRLGMRGRSNVLNSFSSDRYLREHEQMLWIGKYQSRSYVARERVASSKSSSGFIKERPSDEQMHLSRPSHTWWGRLRHEQGHASSAGSSTDSV